VAAATGRSKVLFAETALRPQTAVTMMHLAVVPSIVSPAVEATALFSLENYHPNYLYIFSSQVLAGVTGFGMDAARYVALGIHKLACLSSRYVLLVTSMFLHPSFTSKVFIASTTALAKQRWFVFSYFCQPPASRIARGNDSVMCRPCSRNFLISGFFFSLFSIRKLHPLGNADFTFYEWSACLL
jgi:hypothetical protein